MYNNNGMEFGKSGAKKIAVLAALTGLSLVAFLIEGLLPTVIPGAKPGLANIFSFVALILYSPLEAFLVVGARTLLGAVFAGNLSQLMYSFTGGVASMAVSSLLTCLIYPKISLFAVSVSAAVAHNVTQNVMYVIVSGSTLMFGYLPYLALLGVVAGAIVGGAVMLIFRSVPLNLFEKVISERKTQSRQSNR